MSCSKTSQKAKRKVQKAKVPHTLLLPFALCVLPFAFSHAAPVPRALPTKLLILPSSVELDGPRATERLLVQAVFADGHQEDLSGEARFVSSAPKVAAVEGVTVRARGDGETTVTARLRGRIATVKVLVSGAARPFAWSFRNHVLSVMSKVGCNSGACHGAAAGKNGFKLTLRGYDPETDYATLTRQGAGRRVVRVEPAASLILLKPTLTIPHGGGRRFPPSSPEFQVLAEWIAAGAPPPREDDPRIRSLEFFPAEATLRPAAGQQVLVRARFSDGHTEDVTRWAKYSSSDDGVATVEDDGKVKMRGSGEAAISVWYQSQVAFARLAVPYPYRVDAQVFARARRNNFIDDLVLKKLRMFHVEPSESAGDAEFLRRLHLDAAGTLPTAEEAERFLNDPAPTKRSHWIERLLERPEYVDYWTYKWSDLLLVSRRKLPGNAMWAYYNWIRQSVAANKPWDRFARELLTGTGDTLENGALNFYVIHREPTDLAENVTKAFLGLTITCARCHNHPLEKWTQKDYYAMANLFARVSLKNGTERGDVVISNAVAGDVNHPRLGRPLEPQPLEGRPVPLDAPNRREHLARWLTSPDNPYFARTLVNRVWQNFFGRGLVEPADDLRVTNPASNEELLAALTRDFVESGFDVRRLTRTILNSATYQLSSRTNRTNAADDRYFSHYFVRRLPAEVLLDAYSQVTAVPEKFEDYPPGTRALQLPDTTVPSYFLDAFGRPPRVNTCLCERQQAPSISQALHAINGETLNRKLTARNGTVDMMMKLGLSDEKVADHLYLSALTRHPTGEERRELLKALAETRENRRQAIEDLAWAVLTGKEFMFNH